MPTYRIDLILGGKSTVSNIMRQAGTEIGNMAKNAQKSLQGIKSESASTETSLNRVATAGSKTGESVHQGAVLGSKALKEMGMEGGRALEEITRNSEKTLPAMKNIHANGRAIGTHVSAGAHIAGRSLVTLQGHAQNTTTALNRTGQAGRNMGTSIAQGSQVADKALQNTSKQASSTGNGLGEMGNLLQTVTAGYGALEIGTAMWSGTTQREFNKAYLTMEVGKEKADALSLSIQKIVAAVPGDDTFMNTLLQGAAIRKASITDLNKLGYVAADYLAASQMTGQTQIEAQQDLNAYILTGNTAELQRSRVLQGQTDKLEGQKTVGDRILALNKALVANHFQGLSTLQVMTIKWEVMKGKIQLAATNLGDKVLPYLEQGVDFISELDDKTGGWSTMIGVAAAGVIALGLALGPVVWSAKEVLGSFTGVKDIIAKLSNKKKINPLECNPCGSGTQVGGKSSTSSSTGSSQTMKVLGSLTIAAAVVYLAGEFNKEQVESFNNTKPVNQDMNNLHAAIDPYANDKLYGSMFPANQGAAAWTWNTLNSNNVQWEDVWSIANNSNSSLSSLAANSLPWGTGFDLYTKNQNPWFSLAQQQYGLPDFSGLLSQSFGKQFDIPKMITSNLNPSNLLSGLLPGAGSILSGGNPLAGLSSLFGGSTPQMTATLTGTGQPPTGPQSGEFKWPTVDDIKNGLGLGNVHLPELKWPTLQDVENTLGLTNFHLPEIHMPTLGDIQSWLHLPSFPNWHIPSLGEIQKWLHIPSFPNWHIPTLGEIQSWLHIPQLHWPSAGDILNAIKGALGWRGPPSYVTRSNILSGYQSAVRENAGQQAVRSGLTKSINLSPANVQKAKKVASNVDYGIFSRGPGDGIHPHFVDYPGHKTDDVWGANGTLIGNCVDMTLGMVREYGGGIAFGTYDGGPHMWYISPNGQELDPARKALEGTWNPPLQNVSPMASGPGSGNGDTYIIPVTIEGDVYGIDDLDNKIKGSVNSAMDAKERKRARKLSRR